MDEQKEIPCEVPVKAEPQVIAASQPSEPQPVPIPSININPEDAENKGEVLSKTETMLPESENQKENDTIQALVPLLIIALTESVHL